MQDKRFYGDVFYPILKPGEEFCKDSGMSRAIFENLENFLLLVD